MKRFKCITCKVLQREVYFCASHSRNIVDVWLMPQGLHNEPDRLRIEVQKAIHEIQDIQSNSYDAILLAYGLCSNGIVGLNSRIPLVVPRGHDCITLLLGSKDEYRQYFDSHKGVYWYSPGWIESETMPGKDRFEKTLAQYTEKYGKENAEYLMEMQEGWMKEYEWATYVHWPQFDDSQYVEYSKQCARFMKWKFDKVEGKSGLIQRMMDGIWDEKDFLVLPPGKTIAEDLTSPGLIKYK